MLNTDRSAAGRPQGCWTRALSDSSGWGTRWFCAPPEPSDDAGYVNTRLRCMTQPRRACLPTRIPMGSEQSPVPSGQSLPAFLGSRS